MGSQLRNNTEVIGQALLSGSGLVFGPSGLGLMLFRLREHDVFSQLSRTGAPVHAASET